MNTPHDSGSFDSLLEQYFNDGFAAQLGRAQQAVESDTAAQVTEGRSASKNIRPSRWIWAIGGISTVGLAATLAFAMRHAAPIAPPPANLPIRLNPVIAKAETNFGGRSDLKFASYSKTVDDGIVCVDGQTPIRRLRLQQVKQMSWLDNDGKGQLQVTVPQEHVVFVECPKY